MDLTYVSIQSFVGNINVKYVRTPLGKDEIQNLKFYIDYTRLSLHIEISFAGRLLIQKRAIFLQRILSLLSITHTIKTHM